MGLVRRHEVRHDVFYQWRDLDQFNNAGDILFSDDHTASCIAFSDSINAMLMTHDKYRHFTTRKIADPRTTSGVLICLFVDSRQAVDDMIGKARAAGANLDPSPVDDFDFMYGRSFEDPDGHMWGVSWMDAEAAAKAMAQA